MLNGIRAQKVCAALLLTFMFLTFISVVALAEGATSNNPQPLSFGKSYTFDLKPPLKKYPDPEGKKLTDGVLSPTSSYGNPNWVGFWSTEPFVVNIDLESVAAIRQIRSHHMAGAASITWPVKIFVLASKDNVEWTDPVEMTVTEANPSKASSQWFTVDNLNLEGRWVQVVYMPPVEGKNIFISELEVH